MKELLKDILPQKVVNYIRFLRAKIIRNKIESLPPLTKEIFIKILTDDLKLKRGDVVFIHSAIDKLNLDFPFFRILDIIREIIGESGTALMPTYPKLSSYEFLKSGQIFDVRKTSSYTGILTEFARRQKAAIRSLHPTKSVCAIGPLAETLTKEHHLSPYPYDSCSPYYKIIDYNGIIIGLGVSTKRLSFVHCIEDAMKDDFPVNTYHSECFAAKCIDYDESTKIVKSYAHNMRRMNHNIPKFMSRHIEPEVCQNIQIMGRSFFRAKARELFDDMFNLARQGKTIYPFRSYKKREYYDRFNFFTRLRNLW